jgi:trehalose transport system substrate-binding protein
VGKRWIAAVVVMAFLATACGGGKGGSSNAAKGELSGTSITFSVSLGEEERAAVQDLLDKFQNDTGAQVTLTSVAAQDLPPKLKVDVGAGKPTIHIFAQDNLALRPLVDQGLVEELGDVKLPDHVIPSMVPERFDGKVYFLPFRPNVRVAYENKDRFKQANATAPTTVDEFRTTAEKLKAAAKTPKVTLSLAEGDPAAVTISEWIVSYGGNPLLLNDDGSVKAFEFIQGMWKDNLLARESLQAKFDTEVDNLRGETAWLAQNWPYTSAQLSQQGLLTKFNVFEGWKGPARAAHVIGGDVLGITKGVSGKQRQAAVALAEFLISQDAQKELVARNAWPSVRDDSYGDVPADQKQTFDAINSALKDGWLRPNVSYWSDVSEQMNAAVRRVVTGGENARTVLNELHAKIDAAAKQKGAQYPPAA